MALQEWSDEICVVDLIDDPQFSEDMNGLLEFLDGKPSDVVLNFGAVGFINSSNVAKMLRLRKTVAAQERRLVLCDLNSQVWGVFQVTGLDKIFTFTKDVSTALATVQISNNGNGAGE